MKNKSCLKVGTLYQIKYFGVHGYDSYDGVGEYTGETDTIDGEVFGFKIPNTGHTCFFALEDICGVAEDFQPEYRLVTVDGFDLRNRQIIIKYAKDEPMPMVAVGDTMLVAWKQTIQEQ